MRKLDTLTETERHIFDLYMNGLTAQQITATQHISINTVKFHNKNIYAKLGIGSRNELILLGRMIQGKESETNGQ
jgi:DNA-binding CsgD family transcriptional regulator